MAPKALMGGMTNGITYLPEGHVPEKVEKIDYNLRYGLEPHISATPELDKEINLEIDAKFKENSIIAPFVSGKIVLLNGPAGCGKDTLAMALKAKQGAMINMCSFKKPMFDIAIASSGIPHDVFMARYEDRELKEAPWDRLGGISQRDFMIRISEEWIKPMFGDDHFATLAEEQCTGQINVFTDSGFQSEYESLVAAFGHRNVYLVKLRRAKLNFKGDSRSYVKPGKGPFLDLRLKNDDIDYGVAAIETFILGE